MNICMVIDAYDTSRAGVCVSTQRFVKALRQQHRVTVVSTGKSETDRVVLPSFSPPFFGRTAPFVLARPKRKPLRETICRMDVVHVQLPTWLGRSAVRMAKRLGVPCVASMHRQPENFLLPIGITWQRLVDWLYRFEVKKFYNRCDHVICPSVFAEQELKRYGLKTATTVVSNGVDPFFKPGSSTIRKTFENRFVILTVGRLSQEKDQDIILRAVATSNHREKILLVVVGCGKLEKQLRQTAGKLLGSGAIFLTSGISNEELLDYYRAADLYVHAGNAELECMTVLEAMACGKTPVISDAPKSAAGQFAFDDYCLFRRGDVKSLRQKLDYWISHPKELEESNQRYLQKADEFSIANSVARLVQIYRAVLVPNNRSTALATK